jgi:hypothetical protein
MRVTISKPASSADNVECSLSSVRLEYCTTDGLSKRVYC